MKNTRIPHLLLIAGSLLILPSAFAASFGINYWAGSSKNITGAYDGVATWTNEGALANGDAIRGTTHAVSPVTGVSTWFQTGDYWQSGLNGSADLIYRSTLGANAALSSSNATDKTGGLTAGTGGIAGSWASVISVTGLNTWMTANNYTGYTVTIYYASLSAGVLTDLGQVFSTTYVDANSLSGKTATYQFSAPVGGFTSGSSYYGKSTSATLTDDNILIAMSQQSSINGGIAGVKFDGIAAVPEPSTYGLIGAGALAAVAFVRRRRKLA